MRERERHILTMDTSSQAREMGEENIGA